VEHGSETTRDKLRGRKGNSPDLQLRSLNVAKWERMWDFIDNQEVGLEAATLERKRNSSLVKRSCAENVTGLSHVPKHRVFGSSELGAVGERSTGILA
jgi:hypothetical protein